MDEVEYQSYLAIAVCLDAIQEQQGSWRARLRRVRAVQPAAACSAVNCLTEASRPRESRMRTAPINMILQSRARDARHNVQDNLNPPSWHSSAPTTSSRAGCARKSRAGKSRQTHCAASCLVNDHEDRITGRQSGYLSKSDSGMAQPLRRPGERETWHACSPLSSTSRRLALWDPHDRRHRTPATHPRRRNPRRSRRRCHLTCACQPPRHFADRTRACR